jgi:HAD superfamily hydrolase (TIGR01509 family)
MDIAKLINNAKFLIFDFDGTIADTSPIHEKAFKNVFESFCVNINYKEISGKSTKEAISYLIKINNLQIKDEEVEKLIKYKQTLVRKEIVSSPNFKTLPYVREFIENVYGNYQLAIASSGSRETISLALKKLNLKQYFNFIICSEDVEKSKPSPDIFLKTINLAKYKREDSLIFEDSQNGLKASMAARIPFIDVNIYPFNKTIKYLN